MSSNKPEVHNVSSCCQRRSEPRTQRACIKNFTKIDLAVPEICLTCSSTLHFQSSRYLKRDFRIRNLVLLVEALHEDYITSLTWNFSFVAQPFQNYCTLNKTPLWFGGTIGRRIVPLCHLLFTYLLLYWLKYTVVSKKSVLHFFDTFGAATANVMMYRVYSTKKMHAHRAHCNEMWHHR